MEKLLHQYVPPFEKADFWIEDSCEEIMWTLIFLYFEAIAHDRIPEVNPIYESQMQKIRAWFDPIEHTITDPKEIQFYMYDTDTIRHILSLWSAHRSYKTGFSLKKDPPVTSES